MVLIAAQGGEAACWLDRICPDCGSFVGDGADHCCDVRQATTSGSEGKHLEAPSGDRCDDERMTDLVDRALALWSTPLPPEGEAALAAFRSVYTDPLAVNGSSTPLRVLVDRARMMQGALEDLRHDIYERCETPGRRAFAFRILGRHVGPFATPLGEVPATGRPVELTGMDILLVDEEEGRITGVWATADYLRLLMQMDAIDRPHVGD